MTHEEHVQQVFEGLRLIFSDKRVSVKRTRDSLDRIERKLSEYRNSFELLMREDRKR